MAKCGTCRFYQGMECWRYPPVLLQLAYGGFSSERPRVYEHDFCGEWFPATKEDIDDLDDYIVNHPIY